MRRDVVQWVGQRGVCRGSGWDWEGCPDWTTLRTCLYLMELALCRAR